MTSLQDYDTCLHVQLTGQEEEERIERFLGRLALGFVGVQVVESETSPKSFSIFFCNSSTDSRLRLAEAAVSILNTGAQHRIERGSWEPSSDIDQGTSAVELVGNRLIRLRFKDAYDQSPVRDGLYGFFGQMARLLVRILVHGDYRDGFTDSITTTASPARLYHLQTMLENSQVVEAFAILDAPVCIPPWTPDTSGRWPLAFNPAALQNQ